MDQHAGAFAVGPRELFALREELHLEDDEFYTITGVSFGDLKRFRRGRLREPLALQTDLAGRVTRCRDAMKVAMEIAGEDEEKALTWLRAQSPALTNRSPLNAALTSEGSAQIQRLVEQMRQLVEAGRAMRAQEMAKFPEWARPVSPVKPPARAVAPAPTHPPAAATSVPSLPSSAPSETEGPQIQPEVTVSIGAPRGLARARSMPARESCTTAALPGPASSPVPSAAPKSGPIPAPAEDPKPPTGVDADARVFIVGQRLRPLLEDREWTIKTFAAELVKRGLKQFESQSFASRLTKSYTWATWKEVVVISKMMNVDVSTLAGKPKI